MTEISPAAADAPESPARTARRRGFRHWTAQDAAVALLPALFLAALLMFAHPMMIFDSDPLMHIGIGQWMIAHGAVPHSDPFSYTFLGQPWNAHEWLSQILIAEAYRLGGMSGLSVVFGLACAATAFFLAATLLRFLPPIPALIMLIFPLAFLGPSVQARPHILALPILVFWTGELLAARQEQRAPGWILIPLMVLWANLHGSFFLGLCLLAAFAFEAAIAAKQEWAKALRSWGIVAVGATLAALATPTMLSGFLFPLKMTALPGLTSIGEWQSPIFQGFNLLEVCLFGALLFCLTRGVRVPPIRLLLLLGLLHEGLQHRRHTLILVCLGAMLLAEPIAATLKPKSVAPPSSLRPYRGAAVAALSFLLFISAARLAIPTPLADEYLAPIAAIAHVPDSIVQQPVFNQQEIAGYLIFKGIRPFIDARFELYGDVFESNYSRIVTGGDRPAFEKTLTKYGVVWTVLLPGGPANAILDELPGWRILYQDKFAVVHVRSDVGTTAAN